MKINDTNRFQLYTNLTQKKSGQNNQSANQVSNSSSERVEPTRQERLEQLKKMYSQNRPIDTGKLADKLLGTGMFDERV